MKVENPKELRTKQPTQQQQQQQQQEAQLERLQSQVALMERHQLDATTTSTTTATTTTTMLRPFTQEEGSQRHPTKKIYKRIIRRTIIRTVLATPPPTDVKEEETVADPYYLEQRQRFAKTLQEQLQDKIAQRHDRKRVYKRIIRRTIIRTVLPTPSPSIDDSDESVNENVVHEDDNDNNDSSEESFLVVLEAPIDDDSVSLDEEEVHSEAIYDKEDSVEEEDIIEESETFSYVEESEASSYVEEEVNEQDEGTFLEDRAIRLVADDEDDEARELREEWQYLMEKRTQEGLTEEEEADLKRIADLLFPRNNSMEQPSKPKVKAEQEESVFDHEVGYRPPSLLALVNTAKMELRTPPPKQHKVAYVPITEAAASLGRLGRLNEFTLEAQGKRNVEEFNTKATDTSYALWISNHSQRGQKRKPVTRKTRSNVQIVVNEAAAIGKLRRRRRTDPYGLSLSSHSGEIDIDDLGDDRHDGAKVFRTEHLIDRRVDGERRKKSEDWTPAYGEDEYNVLDDVILPTDVLPTFKPKVKNTRPEDLMEELAQGVAEGFWNRHSRLERPGAHLHVTEACFCKYCKTATAWQTFAYQKKWAEQRLPLDVAMAEDPEAYGYLARLYIPEDEGSNEVTYEDIKDTEPLWTSESASADHDPLVVENLELFRDSNSEDYASFGGDLSSDDGLSFCVSESGAIDDGSNEDDETPEDISATAMLVADSIYAAPDTGAAAETNYPIVHHTENEIVASQSRKPRRFRPLKWAKNLFFRRKDRKKDPKETKTVGTDFVLNSARVSVAPAERPLVPFVTPHDRAESAPLKHQAVDDDHVNHQTINGDDVSLRTAEAEKSDAREMESVAQSSINQSKEVAIMTSGVEMVMVSNVGESRCNGDAEGLATSQCVVSSQIPNENQMESIQANENQMESIQDRLYRLRMLQAQMQTQKGASIRGEDHKASMPNYCAAGEEISEGDGKGIPTLKNTEHLDVKVQAIVDKTSITTKALARPATPSGSEQEGVTPIESMEPVPIESAETVPNTPSGPSEDVVGGSVPDNAPDAGEATRLDPIETLELALSVDTRKRLIESEGDQVPDAKSGNGVYAELTADNIPMNGLPGNSTMETTETVRTPSNHSPSGTVPKESPGASERKVAAFTPKVRSSALQSRINAFYANAQNATDQTKNFDKQLITKVGRISESGEIAEVPDGEARNRRTGLAVKPFPSNASGIPTA
jgi:hypothetical protein